MSKTKSLEEPILQQTENIHDQLNQRFSHLLVKSLISEDNSDDSDSLFKGIKTCKNVTLTRSRTYFDDDLQLFPVTPAKVSDKHALLTSDEEDGFPNSANQSSLFNSNSKVFNGTRSPLKLITHNSMVTTISTGKSARKKSNLENRPKIRIVHSSYTNENVNSNMFTSGVLSPHCTHAPIGSLSYKSAVTVDKTSVKKGKKKVPKTSTPFNKALTLSTVFKTPTSSNNTTPKLSALKRYSIDKAVASAKREIEEMMKTIKLKKRTSKSLKIRGNNSILDDTCDSPVSSTARSCLFSTPTASSNKTNDEKVTAFSMNQTPNNIQEAKKPLTGVKILDIPCKKPMNNSMNSTIEGKTTLSDDEYEDILPTQPLASILLRNVIAYVDVRYGKDCLSEGTRAELESLGAKVEKNFNRKVTHCFFHGGKMSTYRKAIEWKVPLISTLWIEACKTEMDVLPIKGYETYGLDKYREALPLYQLKTKGLRRAVTDSKIRRKPWKENESDKSNQRVTRKPLPPVPTFKKADEVVDALHSVAGDLRKATEQFEKILTSSNGEVFVLQSGFGTWLRLDHVPTRRQNQVVIGQKTSPFELLTSPVLQKKKDGTENSEGSRSKIGQSRNTTNCRRKRNKKLVFGSSSDDDNNKIDHNSSINETEDSSSKISFTNDSEVRISYDSDDLLIYAKKQAANTRSSAPSRLLNSRKCKKLLSSCKEPENKKNEEITVGNNVGLHQEGNRTRGTAIPRPTRTSKKKFRDDDKVNEKEKSSVKKTQTKKRKLLLPSQVIDDFHQDSGESTPPTSPKNPYKATPNKKPRTGLAVKSNTLRTIASVRVTSDCDSDDSLTRAARRESSALFVKKDKKTVPQKTSPTIVCTSLCRSDEEVVKSIVAELGTFTVEAAVSERTTHVVTPTPRRTINLLKGITRGCWVLNVQWVYHSLEAGQWLPEERFELTDFSPAVKLARSDRQAFGPEFGLELFTGLGPFYVCRATVPPSRDLAELLRLGGGAVVSNARVAKIVVGTTPPLSPCGRTPPVMVREKWVLDCITRLTQLPVSDYIVVSAEP